MKKQTSALHDTIILVIITLVAGVILGAVHDVTAGPIAEQEAATQAAAQKEVFPDADSFSEVKDFDSDAFSSVLEQQGIDQTTAKKINKDIKDQKLKVKVTIEADKLRVSSASKDALQTVIQFLRDQDYGQPLQFTNYR